MSIICFFARFEDAAGDGVNGLTVTWDLERITRADGTYVALSTGEATNINIGRRGLYGLRIAGADLTLYDYVATAVTASATPTVHEVAALWTLWSLSWHDILAAAMTVVGSIGERLANIPIFAEFFTVDTGQTAATAIAGSIVGEIIDGVNVIAIPAGAIAFTYTVTNSVTGLPVEGVDVWFTTDIAGTNVVWRGTTDVFGVARDVQNNLPFLDTGTYYVFRQAVGFSATNPDTEVVS